MFQMTMLVILFDVSVNIEENAEKSLPYVLPPGIEQEVDKHDLC